jgi:hypothetical protein
VVELYAALRKLLAGDPALLDTARRYGRVAPALALVLHVKQGLAMTHGVQELL